MIKCPECGYSLNGDESKCPNCGYVLKREDGSPEGASKPEGVKPEQSSGNENLTPPPPPSNLNQPMPFKKPVPFTDSSLSFLDRFILTIKLVLFSPKEFFSEYDLKSDMGMAILFAICMGFINGIVGFIYQLVFRTSLYSMIASFGNIPVKDLHLQNTFFLFGGFMGIIFIPIGVVIGLFISGGIYHLILMLVNGAKNGFESTINVVAYSSAALIFGLIPFCGSTIGWIYQVVLNVIGLTEAHETTTGKALFAVLFPFLLCCLCIVLMYAVLFGAIGIAALSSH